MKLREKFEKETGRTAMYQGDEVEKQPTKQYFEWLEKQLRIAGVSQQRELLKSFVDYAKKRSINDIDIDNDTILYFLEDFNCG